MAKLDPQDIVGQSFGELTVVSYQGYLNTGIKSIVKKHCYTIKCLCGTEKIMARQNLLLSTSCGCANKKAIIINNISRIKPDSISIWNNLYQVTIRSGAARGYITQITFEEFKNLCSKECYYCSNAPIKKSFPNLHGHVLANGIDRIDSYVGYILSNCRPCCEYCNRMKLDRTEQEFFDKIRQIYSKHLHTTLQPN